MAVGSDALIPAAGAPVGRYVLRELMARGGMGEVFRAVAVGAGGFEKPVVVKRILPQLDGRELVAELFIAEARVMSRLSHPNIVQVIDFGRGESDDYFLVMELVDGVDLRDFYRFYADGGEPMPAGLALLIVSQILRGLHHAHTKAHGDGVEGLVHRDVSPGNVLLSTVGDVKVADFGVALVTTPGRDDEPATLAGKLGYMAPEQYRREPVDARADVFSCGVVLFQVLTGKMPFAATTPSERQAQAARGAYRSLLSLRDDLPAELEAIVQQALAPDPAERFASARAMAKAIEAVCDHAGPTHLVMAKSDDLVDAVERVVSAQRKSAKPVLALGVGALREGTVVARGEAEGCFTMQVSDLSQVSTVSDGSPVSSDDLASRPVEPEPATEGPSAAVPAPPKDSPMAAYGIGLVLLLLAGVAGVTLTARDETQHDETQRDNVSPVAQVDAPAPTVSTVAPIPSAEPLTSASPPLAASQLAATPGSTRLGATGRVPSRASASAASVPAPSTPTPAAGCHGKVLLAAKGSWWVSGGPAKVQAPGQYDWPCGSYGLTATSRADKRVVSRSVRVTQGTMASTRFE